MDDRLSSVQVALDALRAVAGDREIAFLDDGELVSVQEAAGLLRRRVDAMLLPVAAEISRRSAAERGRDSLARKRGFGTPAALIAAATGTGVSGAIRLITVGAATEPGVSEACGMAAQAGHPHVASAVSTGRLGVDAAAAIVDMLDRAAPRVARDDVVDMEERLVEAAPGMTPRQLSSLVLLGEAQLDPGGVELREREARAERGLVLRQERSGMISISGRFDPETAAPIAAALDGLVSVALRRRRDAAHMVGATGATAASEGAVRGARADSSADSGGDECRNVRFVDGVETRGTGRTGCTSGRHLDSVPNVGQAARAVTRAVESAADARSVRQVRADALADLCRHVLGCDAAPTGVSATVVVRVSLADLEAGVGCGSIDGVAQPVSVGTVRRLAADARVIPCVLGGGSEILDWGRAKRLFTPAQRLALVERDGGCAFCGAPPGMTAAHHIRWWARDAGPTDLSNGVLLCTSCHHRVHDDGWEIRIEGTSTKAEVWFIPPPWLDPKQTPRPGGRARYGLTA